MNYLGWICTGRPGIIDYIDTLLYFAVYSVVVWYLKKRLESIKTSWLKVVASIALIVAGVVSGLYLLLLTSFLLC